MSFPFLCLKICASPPTRLPLTDPCLPSVGATSHWVIDVLLCPGSQRFQCTLLSWHHGHTKLLLYGRQRRMFVEGCSEYLSYALLREPGETDRHLITHSSDSDDTWQLTPFPGMARSHNSRWWLKMEPKVKENTPALSKLE